MINKINKSICNNELTMFYVNSNKNMRKIKAYNQLRILKKKYNIKV